MKIYQILGVIIFSSLFFTTIAQARDEEPVALPDALYVEGEVIVQFTYTAMSPTIAAAHNTTINNEVGNSDYFLVTSDRLSTEELIEDFSADRLVSHVQPNYIYHTMSETTPWGIGETGVQAIEAQVNGVTGAGIVVAIIDTGVDYNHPDLDNNMWDAPGGTCVVDGDTIDCPNHGYDLVSSDSSGDGDGRDNDPLDYYVHGTHVAGTVAAEDNDEGVIGVAPEAEIMAVRVLSATGFGTTTDIAAGIDFASDNNADIINMSIGATSYDATLEAAVTNAWNNGTVVISAAGNEAMQEISYPAGFEHSISVGALQETTSLANPDEDMDTRLAYFSNYGTVDVVAPGMRVNSTVCDCNSYDGTYSNFNGTSMATPHTAGVAALILEQYPTSTPDEVRHLLESTATDLGESGRDQLYGSGLVNAVSATNPIESSAVLIANYEVDNVDSAPTISLPELPADGASEAPMFVKIMDDSGNFVSNDTVEFSTTLGTFSESGATTYTTTTDGNGIARVTLTSASTVGTATITADSVAYGSASIEIPMSNVLFVADNSEWAIGNTLSWWHRQTFEDISQSYVRFDTMRSHPAREQAPTAEYLEKFDLVIWSLGEYSLSEANQITLQSYMDNGGNVLLSGQDIMYYASSDDIDDAFFSNYFKITPETTEDGLVYAGDNGGANVTGADIFDGITIDLVELTTSGAGPDYVSGLLPDWGILESDGIAIATYDDTTNALAGTKVDTGEFRSILLPFAFETVELRDSRNLMMTEMVNFLLNGDDTTRPSNLTFSNITEDGFLISWDYIPNDADYYTVSYGTNPTADNLGEVQVTDSSTLTISGLEPNTKIYLKVSANVAGEDTLFSGTRSLYTRPLKPTALRLKKRSTSFISTQWTGDASDFTVSYGTDRSASNIATTESSEQFKKITGLKSNKAYYFKVRSDNDSSSSDFTRAKKIRTRPGRVKKLRVLHITRNSATIRFNKVKRPISKYKVELQNKNLGTTQSYATQTKELRISDLNPHTSYDVKVRAFKKRIKGQWSATKNFSTDF